MAERPDNNDQNHRYRFENDSSAHRTEDDDTTGVVDAEASVRSTTERGREEDSTSTRRNPFVKLVSLAALAFVLGGATFAVLGSLLVYVYVKANHPEVGYWDATAANWPVIVAISIPGGLYGTSLVRYVKKAEGARSDHLWRMLLPRNRREPWHW